MAVPSEELPGSQITRLHITPLNPSLLQTYLAPTVLPLAQNISYHAIPTFPEKGYGFVDLPKTEADKLKKKLNGAILRGNKVKIEEARPPKPALIAEEQLAMSEQQDDHSPLQESRKPKRDLNTIDAIELQDRKVKRGWTEPTAAKRKDKKIKKDKKEKAKREPVKSKYTTQPECLFRTTLPPNVVAAVTADEKAEKKKRKKNNARPNEVIVHEFSKTTKHGTFLKSSNVDTTGKVVKEYVEGKGWVDEEGNVVEEVIPKKKKRSVPPPPPEPVMQKADDDESIDSDAESSVIEDESDSEGENKVSDTAELLSKASERLSGHKPLVEDSETSSSGTSSDEESPESDPESESEQALSEDSVSEEAESETSSSDSSKDESDSEAEDVQEAGPTKADASSSTTTPKKLKVDIPQPSSDLPTATAVHPLEALYKKPKLGQDDSTAADPTPSFSFFGANDDIEDSEDGTYDDSTLAVPVTPYSRKGLDLRGQRSAAPTPDTAHPSRRDPSWPTSIPAEDATPVKRSKKFDDESVAAEGAEGAKEGEEAVSDFQKWFYEHRGEANRAWKRRRKVAAKEKRQRENRKRGEQRI
jgi:hypothetical protein